MGIFKSIFGADKKSEVRITPEMAEKIINAFGVVLEKESPTTGCVKDVSRLPYPKEKIKQALIVGLRSVTDRQIKEYLKMAYISLADWQDGVGEKTLGLSTSKLDLNQSIETLAEEIGQQTEGFEKWKPIIQADLKRLQNELRDLENE